MTVQQPPSSRRHALLLLGFGLAWAAGCSNDEQERLYPVSGKVVFDGQPLTIGAVSFRPDSSRGNTSQHVPTGHIDAEGNYKLTTTNRAGAPAGWYKVMVIAQNLGEDGGSTKSGAPAGPRSLVPERYLDPQQTPLSVEVVQKPGAGAYDLNLSK
jgi:hypothetical protein